MARRITTAPDQRRDDRPQADREAPAERCMRQEVHVEDERRGQHEGQATYDDGWVYRLRSRRARRCVGDR